MTKSKLFDGCMEGMKCWVRKYSLHGAKDARAFLGPRPTTVKHPSANDLAAEEE
jgi:hypothetical protein